MTLGRTISPPVIAQPVTTPLTRSAIFLVATVNEGPRNKKAIRSFCGELAALVRSVGSREQRETLSCIMGVGSEAWDRIFGKPLPAELHKFREIHAGGRRAVSTPGDLLFHVRAQRMDLCFEFATQMTTRLGDAISVTDEVHGFRYFDSRNLLGFVDGTENPKGREADDAIFISDEDPMFARGTYVVTQKYLHDMSGWNALPTEKQEKIIGRTKLSDVELDDKVKPSYSHIALNKVVRDGNEIKILRDNMPFGHVGQKEFGTYFIGYSRSPGTLEEMLHNMFVGKPSGNYDRILDFSRPVTGNLFFVPSATFLANVQAD